MFDPVSQDPPHDPDFPASMSEFELTIQNALINGVVYHPAGEGSHPLVLLLHGLPGHERNLDLAQILRRAGWTVCVFHYRGVWASGGDYRFSHILEDLREVISYFRSESGAEKFRVNPERIVTIGHSLGGWASLMTAASGLVDAAASLSGVNVGLWGQQLKEAPEFVRPMLGSLVDGIGFLNGASSDIIVEEIANNMNNWDLFQQVNHLADKHLLILGAKRDEIVPVFDHHMPLVNGLKEVEAPHMTTKMIKADHSYNGNRIELARIILDWLNSLP